MKQIYILLLIVPFFLFSCDKDDDTVDVLTNLETTIPVHVVQPSEATQKSGLSEYVFSATKTYYLKDNADVVNYLDDLETVVLKYFTFEITGLEDDEIINSLEVSVDGGDLLVARENITNAGYGTELPHNVGVYGTVGDVLQSEQQITITVSGTTNMAPMDFDVKLMLQVDVEAKE